MRISIAAAVIYFAVFTVSCAEKRGVNYYRMDLDGRQTFGSGADQTLVRAIKVSVSGNDEADGLRTYRLLFENVEDDPQNFEYSIVWYDRSGAKREAHGNWKRLTLTARAEIVEKIVRPADGNVSTFEIAVRPVAEDR